MQYLNEITALAVLPILLLAFRGYAPHFLRALRGDWRQPQPWMVAYIMAVDFKSILRMAYWDVFRPGHALFVDGIVTITSVQGVLVNSALNLTTGAGAILALVALYYAIPEDHPDASLARRSWSIWSAPFYPRAFLRWPFRRA